MPTHPNALIAADLDADGDVDLAVPGLVGAELAIFENDGTGTLTAQPRRALPGGAIALAAGEVTGDDRIDLVLSLPSAGLVRVLPGPSFDAPIDTPIDAPGHIAIAGERILVANFTTGDVRVLGQPGAAAGPPRCSFLLPVDWDGDGQLEVVAAGTQDDELWILDADLAVTTTIPVGRWPSALAAAQLDDDAPLELLGTANQDGELFVVDLDTVPPRVTSIPAGAGAIALAVADLDGDGALDVAVSDKFQNDLALLAGRPLAVALRLPTGDGPTPLASADLDGDGVPDLAVADGFSNDLVLYLAR